MVTRRNGGSYFSRGEGKGAVHLRRYGRCHAVRVSLLNHRLEKTYRPTRDSDGLAQPALLFRTPKWRLWGYRIGTSTPRHKRRADRRYGEPRRRYAGAVIHDAGRRRSGSRGGHFGGAGLQRCIACRRPGEPGPFPSLRNLGNPGARSGGGGTGAMRHAARLLRRDDLRPRGRSAARRSRLRRPLRHGCASRFSTKPTTHLLPQCECLQICFAIFGRPVARRPRTRCVQYRSKSQPLMRISKSWRID